MHSRFALALLALVAVFALSLSPHGLHGQEEVPPTAADAHDLADPINAPGHTAGSEQAEEHDDAHGSHGAMGSSLPLWTVVPFAALLLCIAILPLVAPHWWEHNSSKAIIVTLLALPVALYLLFVHGAAGQHELVDKFKEYVSFIILLASLYIISGGVYVQGSLSGTPLANTGLLALGAIIANFIGTTGASVLLIRPLLRANQARQRKVHIVIFFIFIVSNCGGLLTPLGDPPLFLGFLKGVPFLWTLENLWPHWLVVNLGLLVIFHFWDQAVFNREEKERPGSQLEEVQVHAPLKINGLLNFVFLAGVVLTIAASGQGMFNGGNPWPYGVQEGIMTMLAVLAYFTTPSSYRENNRFTFGPIIEVAVLFIGIFITMAPALQILNAWGSGNRPDLGEMAITAPWQYFWATGILSSFLDNAPTYLTFAATACGMKGVDAAGPAYLAEFLKQPGANELLRAISAGAVFMGANTYIGNGPNFMVKAIAEENGVKMPSFFGYMAYSVGVLVPLLIVVTVLFFRG